MLDHIVSTVNAWRWYYFILVIFVLLYTVSHPMNTASHPKEPKPHVRHIEAASYTPSLHPHPHYGFN